MKQKNRMGWILRQTKIGILVVLVVFGVGFYFFQAKTKNDPEKPIAAVPAGEQFGWKFPISTFPIAGSEKKLIAYSNMRDPGGVPRGLPVRLKIPAIGVNAAVEDALITPDGRMDIPAGTVNVAWFSLGPHPGEVGSSVIAGHYGIDRGVPKVFYNLNKLRVGNKIYVEDDSGNTLAFLVTRTQKFDRNADATTVFTSGDGKAHLNIITCEGIWNQVNDSYPERLVIFTDSIPGEGAVMVKKKTAAAAVPTPIFPTAAKTEPTPAPSENPAPVAAKDANTSLLNESEAAIYSPSPKGGISQTLKRTAQDLFATPKDSAITTVLLLLIGFLIFKFTRR